MKFNKEAKTVLRKEVNDKIETLKFQISKQNKENKIKIEKDMLELILFDEHVDDDGFVYKTIGYTYNNLLYLDLSDVNFENVSFDVDDDNYVDLSSTNIKIDFMKTYNVRKYKQLVLKNVSFKDVDLSNNNYVDETGVSVFHGALVINTDLSFTKLKITTPELHFHASNLFGVDLSELNMYPDDVISTFRKCDLKNTGLNIKVSEIVGPDSIKEIMCNPSFEGCIIGGKKILSKKEQTERAFEILHNFESWRDATIDEVVSSIEDQVKSPNNNGNNKKNTRKNEVSSFYGCDDAPLQPGQGEKPTRKGKKLNKTIIYGDVSSFYGCDN